MIGGWPETHFLADSAKINSSIRLNLLWFLSTYGFTTPVTSSIYLSLPIRVQIAITTYWTKSLALFPYCFFQERGIPRYCTNFPFIRLVTLISKRDWESTCTNKIAGDEAAMWFAIYEPDSISRTCYLGSGGMREGTWYDSSCPQIR